MPIIFLGVCLLLSLIPLSANQETKQSADAAAQTQEVLEQLPSTMYGMPEAGLQRFRRCDLEFSIVLDGFCESLIADGPHAFQPWRTCLGTYMSCSSAAWSADQYSFPPDIELYVIVKNPPKIAGKPARTGNQLIRFLSEDEPEFEREDDEDEDDGNKEIDDEMEYNSTIDSSFYRLLRKNGSLMEIRPWSGQGITGAIFCYSYISNRTYYPGKETPKTITTKEWHFDFITLIKGRLLLLQFTARLPLASPLPKDLLSRIESTVSTLQLINRPRVHSIKSAIAAAKICLVEEPSWRDYEDFNLSKPAAVERIHFKNQKAWRVVYKKHKTGKRGQLIVIVGQNGLCNLTCDAEEQTLKESDARAVREESIDRMANDDAAERWSGALGISVQQRPKLRKQVEPILVEEAVKKKMSATVVIKLVADVYGRVVDVKVVNGHSLFNDAALKAVLEWRYEPFILHDFPNAVRFIVVLSFKQGKFSAAES